MKDVRSREKIGRNDPCWCGSGKKYKKCHLNRENEEPIQPWETDKAFKRVLERRDCLVPIAWRQNCSSQIVQAHTVPRSGSLARIARDGHVYSYKVSIQELMKNQGEIKPRLIGINKASTFTGFCSEHDRSIFAPVETVSFSATSEQCFLLGYRALARELFTKEATSLLTDDFRLSDRGMPLDDQFFVQACAAEMEVGNSVVKRDHKAWKSTYDDILVARDFERVRAYVIKLTDAPPVMCSGAYYPQYDFDGIEVQDLLDLECPAHPITITSFHGGHYGAIVMTWVEEGDHICVPFVRSLHKIKDDLVTDALLRFFFSLFENIHISPLWWEQLSSSQQQILMERFYRSSHPFIPLNARFLTDDGHRFDEWPIIGRRCVGFEL